MKLAILVFLTGFLWGMGPIFDKYALSRFSSDNALWLRVATATIIISVAYFFLATPKTILKEFTLPAFVAIIMSGLVGFGGVYTFYKIIQVPGIQVSKMYAISLAICPLVTAIFAYFFYHEDLIKPMKLAGIVFVMLGIYLLSYQSHA